MCHLVPKGHWINRVLSGQRDATEEDEEEDDVGEGGGVDDLVAQLAEPEKGRQRFVFKNITLDFGNIDCWQ